MQKALGLHYRSQELLSTLFYQILFPGRLDRSLGGGEACNGHTEGRAADVVQTDVVAELHARGIAAVLTADAQAQVGTGLTHREQPS